MIGESLVSRLNSPAAKKWVLWSLESGPPSEISDWPRESLVRSLPLAALAVVEPARAAEVADGPQSSATSPWSWLPPLLVTMLMTLPVEPPYSAEKALVSTDISSRAVRGRLLKMVWRPQLSLPVLPSTSNHASRRPAPLVVKRFSFMKTSPWLMAGRLAAFSMGR